MQFLAESFETLLSLLFPFYIQHSIERRFPIEPINAVNRHLRPSPLLRETMHVII